MHKAELSSHESEEIRDRTITLRNGLSEIRYSQNEGNTGSRIVPYEIPIGFDEDGNLVYFSHVSDAYPIKRCVPAEDAVVYKKTPKFQIRATMPGVDKCELHGLFYGKRIRSAARLEFASINRN